MKIFGLTVKTARTIDRVEDCCNQYQDGTKMPIYKGHVVNFNPRAAAWSNKSTGAAQRRLSK